MDGAGHIWCWCVLMDLVANNYLPPHLLAIIADTQGSAIFSGRREGFALYFARLIRPMWKAKLTKLGYGDFCANVLLHVSDFPS